MSWDGIKDYQEYIGKSLKMPFENIKGCIQVNSLLNIVDG